MEPSAHPPQISNGWAFAANLTWHLLTYLIVAGTAFLVFHLIWRRFFVARRIQAKRAPLSAMQRDLLYSVSSAVIFSLVGLLTHVMITHRWTKAYVHVSTYGWIYFWFSLALMIVLHDAWFYWTHRFMHWRPVFPIFHRVHHLSHTPTPWSALAFHPTEAVVQAIIFPLVILFVPVHLGVALLWLLYMIVINVWGHLGIELFPAGFRHHWLFKWHNTTTHHDMHHQHLRGNYSLYFNFWDRVMGTNDPDYCDKS